ncbi:MAG: HesA/MoeB/ThiF family protein, partial [Betaproteobacteria bacterium]|nr:HesA/MoeB/ThiF family protein [Betaproteobacteria bacterium]
MDDAQLLRYSRHLLLDELGVEGQQRLIDSHALILGAGGLGSPVALYLAASGVGRITLIDDDVVDLTNLQRQIAHTTQRVGQPKVESARDAMRSLNPLVQVQPLQIRADETALLRLVAEADVVIDGCDNFATRHAVNRACVQHA